MNFNILLWHLSTSYGDLEKVGCCDGEKSEYRENYGSEWLGVKPNASSMKDSRGPFLLELQLKIAPGLGWPDWQTHVLWQGVGAIPVSLLRGSSDDLGL